MMPEQQKLLEKANRSLQAARELNGKGFPDFAASRAYSDRRGRQSIIISRLPLPFSK